jgi:ParE toxin of type II toxin-antitoxin system, parDE
LREAISKRHRELEVPGAAALLGEPCKGRLRRCRKIKVGSHHRMVYLIRRADVVVLAVWLRKDLAAYDQAGRALDEALPPSPTRERS